MHIGVPGWWRGRARVTGDWIEIVELTDVRSGYDAANDWPDVPFTLAGVRTPREAERFVASYGLLRYGGGAWLGYSATPMKPNLDKMREPYTAWREDIARLNEIMDLYIDQRRADDGEEDAVNALRDIGWRSAWPEITKLVNAGRGDLGVRMAVSVSRSPDDGTIVEAGAHNIIRANTLIAAIYHQLSELLEAKRDMRYCDDCGRVFLVGDPRQRFCNNTCASRSRQRRRAERLQEQTAGAVDAEKQSD